ncbi:MAG: hypothetical protein H0X16_09570 [Chloroflexi bacterium]|nr:hypothetical protein [Chloroflexota bacterium]
MPDEAADARGSTFIGTVINIRVIQREYTARLISFDVERVYAGGSVRAMPGIGLPRQELAAGKSATLYANPCDGIRGLRVGDSALVSTADLDDPQTWTSAVWRLSDGRAKLIRMAEALGDVRLEEADTVERALALVAPGALSMPDTSTAARTEPRARLRI